MLNAGMATCPHTLAPTRLTACTMIICSCNAISDHDVRDIVVSAQARPCSAAQVYDCLGCIVQCGQCSRSVRRILEEYLPDYQQGASRTETEAAICVAAVSRHPREFAREGDGRPSPT